MWLHQQDTYMYLPEIRRGHIFDTLDAPTFSLYWPYTPDFIHKSLEVKSRKHLGRSTFSELCYIVFYKYGHTILVLQLLLLLFYTHPSSILFWKEKKKRQFSSSICQFLFFSSALYPPFSIFSSQINSNICY